MLGLIWTVDLSRRLKPWGSAWEVHTLLHVHAVMLDLNIQTSALNKEHSKDFIEGPKDCRQTDQCGWLLMHVKATFKIYLFFLKRQETVRVFFSYSVIQYSRQKLLSETHRRFCGRSDCAEFVMWKRRTIVASPSCFGLLLVKEVSRGVTLRDCYLHYTVQTDKPEPRAEWRTKTLPRVSGTES